MLDKEHLEKIDEAFSQAKDYKMMLNSVTQIIENAEDEFDANLTYAYYYKYLILKHLKRFDEATECLFRAHLVVI